MKAVEVDTLSSHFDSYPEIELKRLPSGEKDFMYMGVIGKKGMARPSHFISKIPKEELDCISYILNVRDLFHNVEGGPSQIIIDLQPVIDLYQIQDPLTWMKLNRPFVYNEWELRSDFSKKMFHRYRPKIRERMCEVDNLYLYSIVSTSWVPMKASTTYQGMVCLPSSALYVDFNTSKEYLGVLSSFLFELMVRKQCSTLSTTLRYTPTEVLPYFPFPWEPAYEEGIWKVFPERTLEKEILLNIENSMTSLENFRKYLLKSGRFKGPTDLYIHYDNPSFMIPEIQELRQAHVELFNSVLTAYGWRDLIEPWTFDKPWICKTNRFVPTEHVRRELLQRIADLNLERYEKEIEMLNKP